MLWNLYYDKAGQPIDMYTFARLHVDRAYIRVARTTIVSAVDPATAFDVSTVWLGLDHGWGGGPPLIFETMVFSDGADDHDCRRYATEAQALAGHHDMVTVVAATLDDPVIMDVSEDAATQPPSEEKP